MTTCFVEQHTTASALDDDRHCTTRRRTRAQFGDCLTCCTLGKFFNALFVKQFETNGEPNGVVAGLHASVAICNGAHAEDGAHLLIGSQNTITVRNENATCCIAVSSRHLHDALVNATRNIVGDHQEFHLASLRHRRGWNTHIVDLLTSNCSERHRVYLAITGGCCCGGGFGCCEQTLFSEVGRVGKAGGFTIDDTNASTAVATAVDSLDLAVIKACAHVSFVFNKDFRKTRSGGTALR